jgi:molecular chaperone DnaK
MRHPDTRQPALVVDFGAHSTGAAVVIGDKATLVRDPFSGSLRWPSQLSVEGGVFYAGAVADRVRYASPRYAVDAPRRALDSETVIPIGDQAIAPSIALSAFLGSLRAEALRITPERIDRLTLTVPTAYQVPDRRRDLLIAAGEAAGFPEVELISAAAAIVLDAVGSPRMRDVGLPDGSLVLVCDLGESWSTALLRVTRHEIVPIMQETTTSGRDLDAQLLSDLRVQYRDWLEPRLAMPGDAGLRVRQQAVDFLRQIKHALCDLEEDGEIAGRLAPDAPSYVLGREWLDRLAEPGLRWVGGSCRSLLARAAAGWGGSALGGPGAGYGLGSPGVGSVLPSSTINDVSAVVLAGGHARLASAERILREELQRPVVRLDDPELAPVRGAVRFTIAAPTRRIVADHPRWRVEALSWDVPTGRGRLERWTVGAGAAYQRGAVLAQVRTTDERVYDLSVPEEGVLLSSRGRVGDVVGPTLIASAKRPSNLLAGDPPGKRQELTGSGEWLLTPDRRLLVECAAAAERVRLWSIPDGVLVREFRPEYGTAEPRQGRVFVNPGGRLSLVVWDPSGTFSVWDVRSGERTTTFRDGNRPSDVLVNEQEWRLSVAGEDGGSAGRYRRSVATVWDLASGRKLEKLTDDWPRRLTGFRDRSSVDGFGEHAFSPDGRLRAVPVLGNSGPTGIALQEATSEHEVFRSEHGPSRRVRVAFSADGQFLLANRESPRRSQVDVWEL